MKHAPLVLLCAAVLLAAGGCTQTLADAMVYAPNRGDTPDSLAKKGGKPKDSERVYRLEVGPPSAVIAVAVRDPEHDSPHATVFVLHGIWDTRRKMRKIGLTLNEAGYRTVLVDSRGHGQSSGHWLTYGLVESVDMRQVLDHLEREGEIAGPVGVYGTSYGGAVALQWAARDDRVDAVVAVAAFSSMPEAAHSFTRKFIPKFIVPDERLDEAIEIAGEQAGFEPSAAAPAAAISTCPTPVLLIYGMKDKRIPLAHGERIDAAAPKARLVVVEGRNHNSIMKSDVTRASSLGWFDEHLNDTRPAK